MHEWRARIPAPARPGGAVAGRPRGAAPTRASRRPTGQFARPRRRQPPPAAPPVGAAPRGRPGRWSGMVGARRAAGPPRRPPPPHPGAAPARRRGGRATTWGRPYTGRAATRKPQRQTGRIRAFVGRHSWAAGPRRRAAWRSAGPRPGRPPGAAPPRVLLSASEASPRRRAGPGAAAGRPASRSVRKRRACGSIPGAEIPHCVRDDKGAARPAAPAPASRRPPGQAVRRPRRTEPPPTDRRAAASRRIAGRLDHPPAQPPAGRLRYCCPRL